MSHNDQLIIHRWQERLNQMYADYKASKAEPINPFQKPNKATNKLTTLRQQLNQPKVTKRQSKTLDKHYKYWYNRYIPTNKGTQPWWTTLHSQATTSITTAQPHSNQLTPY